MKAAGRRGSRVWGPGSGVLGPGRAAPAGWGSCARGGGRRPAPGLRGLAGPGRGGRSDRSRARPAQGSFKTGARGARP